MDCLNKYISRGIKKASENGVRSESQTTAKLCMNMGGRTGHNIMFGYNFTCYRLSLPNISLSLQPKIYRFIFISDWFFMHLRNKVPRVLHAWNKLRRASLRALSEFKKTLLRLSKSIFDGLSGVCLCVSNVCKFTIQGKFTVDCQKL